jgi:hypothetical protein
MSLQHTCRVGLTRVLDVLTSPVNGNTIETAEVDLRSTALPFESNLRHSRVEASNSDVVDLSAKKDDNPVDCTSVDTSRVCGAQDIEIVEDLVDVLFPGEHRLRGCAPLQGLEHL